MGQSLPRVRDLVVQLTDGVVCHAGASPAEWRHLPYREDIQDQVELALMRSGEHDVARAYVLYREKRNQERAQQKRRPSPKFSR